MSSSRRPARSQPEARSQGPSAADGDALGRRHNVDPFALFCAYHLGITADDGYRFQHLHQVAKRFGAPVAVLRQLLSAWGMDTDAVVHSSFDMAGAQVDVMVVPEGVSRTAVARALYEDFCKAPRRNRDWQRELADDARANERTFGPGNGQR